MKKSFERVLSGLLVLAMLIAMPVAAMADGGSTVVDPVSVSPLCDHDYTHADTTLNLSKASVTAPTCTTAGYTKYTCTKCGQVIYDNFQAPTGHDYSKVTVNSNGTKTFACVKGDAKYTVKTATEETGHMHEATGADSITDVSSTETISPVAGITYVVQKYTCSLEDANGVSGKGCGYTQVVYLESADANHHSYEDHTFGPWKYTTNPTESKNGVAQHTCTECGFVEKVLTPMQNAQAKIGRINKDLVNAYTASTGDTVALLLAKGTTFEFANDLVNGRYCVTSLKDVNSGEENSGTYYVNPADVEVNPGSVNLTTAYGGLQEIVKVQTDGQVNVRSGKSSTSAVQYTVGNGRTMEVYRIEENDAGERWGRVSKTANEWILLDQAYLLETEAFGFGSQMPALSDKDPEAKKVADTGTVVKASTVIVYADRDASSASVGTLPKNTKVTFYYQKDGSSYVSPFSKVNNVAWGYLDKDEAKRLGLSDAGYVDMSTIHLASDPNPVVDEEDPDVVAIGVVTSSINLRVRSEPKISVLNQIGSLPTGTQVKILEIGDYNGASWGRINYNGKTGWICMTYVQIQKSNTGSSDSNTSTNAKENGTVVNCSVAVNVRDAAKIQGRLVTTIKVGSRVAITKLENGWGLVDGKGWVYMDYVKLDAGAEDEIKNGTNNGGNSGSNNPVKTYTNVSALGEVTAETMTVYKETVAKPGTELLKLVKGNTFVITDRTIINNEIWFKTTVGSVTGWAQGGAFDDDTQEPENVTLPALSGTVTSTTLNVYAEHSADSTVKDVLGVNTAVKVTAQWTDGIYVWGQLSNERGWVQMNNLKLDVPESNVVTGISVGTAITGTTYKETPVYSAANNDTVLLKLAANRTVTVTDWYLYGDTLRGKITDGSIVGWIDLENINQNAVDATVTQDIIYLYTEAGNLSTKSTLSKRQNEKLSVIERTLVANKTAWGKISVKDASGMPNYYWINLSSTSLTAGSNNNNNNNNTNNGGSNNNSGTTTAATGTIVNADEVNVRSAAGVANAKVTTLKRGTQVTVYEQTTVDNALWGRIDQGWVAMQYVDLSSKANNGSNTTVPSGSLSGNTILTTVPTGAIGVGFVNTKNLAVRNGAGQGYTQTATLPLYTNVVIYEHVLKDGMIWGRCDQGWICTSYVTYTGTSVTGSGTAGTIARCFYTANVRSAPGVGNALVGKVMVNSRVEILEQKEYSGETWGRTSLGWVSMQYVLADGTIPTP